MKRDFSPRDWDRFVAAHPRAHVLQQCAWGDLKAAFGWSVDLAAISDGKGMVGGAQLLFRPLPFRLGTMAYLPMGPLLTNPDYAAGLWYVIHRCAREHGAAFLKWEPGIYTEGEAPPDFKALGFRPTPRTLHPPRPIRIDISAMGEPIPARITQARPAKFRQSGRTATANYEPKTAANGAPLRRCVTRRANATLSGGLRRPIIGKRLICLCRVTPR